MEHCDVDEALVFAGSRSNCRFAGTKKATRIRFQKKRKWLLLGGCVLLFASLLFFKFFNAAASLFASEGLSFAKIAVPVGIAFYTLQIGSYLFDVYNKSIQVETNPLRFFLFAIYFPGILQGPISRYEPLSTELLCKKEFDYDQFISGFIRVLWGFFKKMVIADRLFMLTQTFFGDSGAYQGVAVAVFAVVYKIQIYADFAGGIDISLGLSKMLGIDLAENFNLPYFSKNVSEYWRRWHMTLGAWFKDYVFFPLSLSGSMTKLSKKLRKFSVGLSRYMPSILCMLVLWFCSAIWHGEGTQFLLWGLFHWIMVTIDVIFERKIENGIAKRKAVFRKLTAGLQILGTFLIVSFGELMFKANGVNAAFRILGSIFRPWDWSFFRLTSLEMLGLDRPDLLVGLIAIGVLFVVELLMYLQIVPEPAKKISKMPLPIRWFLLFLLIGVIVVFGMYGRGYDPVPFVYFQF